MSVSSTHVLDDLMGFNTSITSKGLNNSSFELLKLLEGQVDVKDDDKFSNVNIFKDMITNIEDKSRMLTDEVLFLRKESERKDDIIMKLLNIVQSRLPISLRAEESNEKSQTAFDIPHEYLSLDNTIEHDQHVESTRVNIVGYEESICNEEIPNCINPSENMTTQLANYKLRQQQKYEQENTVTNNFDTSLNNAYESDDTFETSH